MSTGISSPLSILNPAGIYNTHPGSAVPYPDGDGSDVSAPQQTPMQTCMKTHGEAQCVAIIKHQNHIAYGLLGALVLATILCHFVFWRKMEW